MAKNRMINTRFWSDGFIIDLNPLDRYLFLYLLTNEHTNICGIYELPLKRIADETGIEKDMVSKMLTRFSGKIQYIDGWVYIKNFSKHQSDNLSVKKGVDNARKLVPHEILNKIAKLDTLSQGGYRVGTEPEVFESEFESELESELNSKRDTVSKIDTEDDVKIIPESSEKKKPKNKGYDDQTPCSLNEFVEIMEKSPQRHIKIIGMFADTKKPDFTTKGQWRSFRDRNLRIARTLSPYTDNQISKAFSHIEENLRSNKNPKGYITKWTLETLSKYLEEI